MCAGGEIKAFFIWHSTAFPPELVATFGQTKGRAWGTGTDTSMAHETVCVLGMVTLAAPASVIIAESPHTSPVG